MQRNSVSVLSSHSFSGSPLVAQWLRICLPIRRHEFNPSVGKIPWRRKWQLTLVFLPGESHGQRSLTGYSSWGHKESDTTERLHCNFNFTLSRDDSHIFNSTQALWSTFPSLSPVPTQSPPPQSQQGQAQHLLPTPSHACSSFSNPSLKPGAFRQKHGSQPRGPHCLCPPAQLWLTAS